MKVEKYIIHENNRSKSSVYKSRVLNSKMGSSNSKDSFETPMREEVMDDSRSRSKANSDEKKSPVKSEFIPEENSKDSAEMPNKEDVQ